jgi:hypothetical protein
MVSLYADGGALDSQTTETQYVDGLSSGEEESWWEMGQNAQIVNSKCIYPP